MMNRVFVAEFRYGTPFLSVVTCIKETTKTVSIERDSIDHLLGRNYLPGRLHKEKYYIAEDGRKAVYFLLEKAQGRLKSLQQEQAKMNSTVKMLQQLYVETTPDLDSDD